MPLIIKYACDKCGHPEFLAIPDSLARACLGCGRVLVKKGDGTFEEGASLKDWARDISDPSCTECNHHTSEHKEASCYCDRTTPDENGCLAHADPAKGPPNRPCTHKNCACPNLNGPPTPYKRWW